MDANKFRRLMWFAVVMVFIAFLMSMCDKAHSAEVFKITAYCSCHKCCNKIDGITASGLPARDGYVACNWLPFGTKVNIEGMGVYSVQDRGARSLFGSKKNHIKHLDVWFPSHKEARNFGVQYKKVEVL